MAGSDRNGTSDCADEVTLSRKGAKSRTGIPGLRSTRTKTGTRAAHVRESPTELERKLTEALEREAASSEVLRVISSSPGELEPVFQAMLANAARICGAKFGNLWLREGDSLRIVATHGAPAEYRDYLRRNRWSVSTQDYPWPNCHDETSDPSSRLQGRADLRQQDAHRHHRACAREDLIGSR